MPSNIIKYVQFVTEPMTARSPHLSEPETEGAFPDGKYKTDAIAVDEAYTKAFQAEIQKVAEANFPGKTITCLPWKETKEGDTAFVFKSPKKKPDLVDAKGQPLNNGVSICGGSIIRIGGLVAAWEKGRIRGVSLWLDAVRVLKLAETFKAASVFGPPEDGFDQSAPQ
ncbi:hypothetical protein BJ122_11987 [Rhodopseudomonas faecalis]|uniref:Uncharacterized protein n=1 Tax=Rhodopseudomonas faecalis TaxID=99655 RepID=A0A318TCY2_9BRAD|nr:hypothetical protein [Rhodopseudomonas faecalis]PYF01680.1 hypothetical protein BJ122_11987 [Rhodopseudomonas faecalis]